MNILINAAIKHLGKGNQVNEEYDQNSPNINTLLSHSDPLIRKTAFVDYGTDEGVTAEHITKGLRDPDWRVRYAALNHEGATQSHIGTALSDPDLAIRSSAAEHHRATPYHLGDALNDESPMVRLAAVNNSNINHELLHRALSDHDQDVRHSAVDILYHR